eukprot:5556088-Alexandrium_andersonii.AAC.1
MPLAILTLFHARGLPCKRQAIKNAPAPRDHPHSGKAPGVGIDFRGGVAVSGHGPQGRSGARQHETFTRAPSAGSHKALL